MRLAVSRTPRARGRINRLIVSMIIRTGIRGAGVPSGRRCPSASVGLFHMPMITVASQRGTAKPRLSDSCVVGVNVYGRRPSKLRVKRNTINEVRRRAHLWAPTFKGRSSCWVNRAIDQFWTVSSRLLCHRPQGVGYKTQGRLRAIATRGIPRYVGLAN